MKRVFPLLLVACIPLKFSGSSVPTDHTFRLTEADIAAANSTDCAQTWVGASAEMNVAKAKDRLRARGVKITEKEVLPSTTAYAKNLRVGKGFWGKPLEEQAQVLSHELVHYCRRNTIGDAAFVELWGHSAGRWQLEVQGYAQGIRTFRAMGVSTEELQPYISKKVLQIRNFYLLWDIEPSQYEDETRRAFEVAAQ